jgi:hypothetical protein
MGEPVAAYGRAAQLVASGGLDADEVLAALAAMPAIRTELDRLERELIGAARAHGVGWPAIARSLGLGTRQAAEQRWLRLRGGSSRDPAQVRTAQREQRIVDDASGKAIVELRRAAVELYRHIESDHGWDGRNRRAALARASLAAALDAPPSALYALSHNAIDDLTQVPMGSLPPTLAAAVRRFRSAIRQARAGG